jgi:putative phosphoesterase
MKIGIISDSHDHHANVLKAVEIFKKQNVEYILHAGDIVSPFTANAFSAVTGAKLIAVFGNNDGEKAMLKSTIESFGGQIHHDPWHGVIGGKKIFMTHKPGTVDEAAGSGKYDIIIYGHAHIRDIRTAGKTLIINPGEATDWICGKGRVVILDTDNLKIEEIEL